MQQLVFINSTGDTFTPTHSGAIATWIWEMCRAASSAGCSPWVISRDSPEEPYPWSQKELVRYPYPPPIKGAGRILGAWSSLRGWGHIGQGVFIRRVRAALRRRNLQRATLVFHNDPEALVALRRSFPDARMVHVFHNCNRIDERWRKKLASCADVTFAVSAYCARWNESYFGCPVHILRNGIDARRFVPVLKPEPREPVIGFVGRVDRQKAPDLLLRAALDLARRRNDFSLQLLGARFYGRDASDPYQEMLLRLIRQLEQKGITVRRPGFVNRLALPRELAQADIHVVPSRWEDPCPLTLMEGMATGGATVASRSGGVPELAGDAALLFERDDLKGLTGHLDMLLRHPELRASYGRRARQQAESRTWRTVYDELLQVLGV